MQVKLFAQHYNVGERMKAPKAAQLQPCAEHMYFGLKLVCMTNRDNIECLLSSFFFFFFFGSVPLLLPPRAVNFVHC